MIPLPGEINAPAGFVLIAAGPFNQEACVVAEGGSLICWTIDPIAGTATLRPTGPVARGE
jgi:hypothetical protein